MPNRHGKKLSALALFVATLGLVMFAGSPGYAARPSADLPAAANNPVSSRQVTALPASLSASVITYAQRGEGVIRITTRVCGTSRNWQAVAAANGIRPPVYLVLLGQRMSVTCTSTATTSGSKSSSSSGATTVTSSGWVRPLTGCVVSPFGVQRPGHIHAGVDIHAGYGVAIHAIAAGTVTVGYQAGGAGNWTAINHGNGIWSVYMHQSRYAVTSGHVAAGQVIGYVGSTGNASGPHLHFEIHTAGLWHGKVDPVPFMRNHGAALSC